MKKPVLILALFLLLTGCAGGTGVINGDGDDELRDVVFHAQNGDYKISAEIADEPDEIARGLMFREKLEEDKGMLFIFEEEALRAFWMKNALVPLDIIFISADKRVINIAENAQPCKKDPCENYKSVGPAKYVIEIAGGENAVRGIRFGDSVEF